MRGTGRAGVWGAQVWVYLRVTPPHPPDAVHCRSFCCALQLGPPCPVASPHTDPPPPEISGVWVWTLRSLFRRLKCKKENNKPVTNRAWWRLPSSRAPAGGSDAEGTGPHSRERGPRVTSRPAPEVAASWRRARSPRVTSRPAPEVAASWRRARGPRVTSRPAPEVAASRRRARGPWVTSRPTSSPHSIILKWGSGVTPLDPFPPSCCLGPCVPT
ncbi:unnamed protein product [Eretmochelys imbricata]